MRKRRKITTMDTQERYFQNSLRHPSLPTALFFLADPRALIKSISSGIAYCSAAFFMPTKKGPVCGRLTSSFLAEAFRPTPVSRERSTAVSTELRRPDFLQRLHRRRAYAEIDFAVRERASATLLAQPLLVEAAQSRFVFLQDFPARPAPRDRCWRRRRRRKRRQEMPGAPGHGRA